MQIKLLLLVGAFVLAAAVSRADNWPQFRGPGGSGITKETHLPVEWSKDKNIAWKVKVPGYAWSSPIAWGDKVLVTTAVSEKQAKPSSGFFGSGQGFPGKGAFGKGKGDGGFGKRGGDFGGFGKAPDAVYQWQIHCLGSADGKVLWSATAAEHKPSKGATPMNTYATETPVTDGERVYAYFGMAGVVFCCDLTGKELWQTKVGTYATAFGHGTGASPALGGNRLFLQCDNEGKSFLIALDSRTGKELWRTPRRERTGWSTPLVWTNAVRTEVVCLGTPRVRSYDPATGKQLWELGGLSGQAKASPVASAELLYVGTGGGFGGFGGGGGVGGGGRPFLAVKAGASGDITLKDGARSNEGVAWHLPKAGPPTASPLVYEGQVYVLEERGGLLSCYDARTGKQVYKERLQGASGFTSSPWACGGKVFCLDHDGTTHIVKAGPAFELLAQNKLGEMTWSSPAVANGNLLIRTVDHLYCIREGAKKR